MSLNKTVLYSDFSNLIPENSDDVRNYIFNFLRNPKFRSFSKKYANKIRSKLKGCKTFEDRLDVIAELELAYLLIDHVNKIIYEPKKKGPDFHIQFFESCTIAIEVRRIRELSSPINEVNGIKWINYSQKESIKFTDIILNKLKQFDASQPNILYIRSNSIRYDSEELYISIDEIRKKIYNNDISFLKRKKYDNVEKIVCEFSKITAFMVKDTLDRENLIAIYEDSEHKISSEILEILKKV